MVGSSSRRRRQKHQTSLWHDSGAVYLLSMPRARKARLWCGVDCFIKRAPVLFVDTFSKSQEVMYVMLALNSPPTLPPPTLSFQTKLPKYQSRRLMCDLQTDFEGSSDFSTASSMHTHFFVFYLLAADSCLLSRKQFMLLALSHRATLTVRLHV